MPERPKTPPRRRTKKPTGKAKKWLFDKTWVPEDGPRPSTPVLEGSDSGNTSSYEEDDRSSISTDTHEAVAESTATVVDSASPKLSPGPSVPERARIFNTRSVTAPVGLGLEPLSSPTLEKTNTASVQVDSTGEPNFEPEHRKASDALSLISSADSFHSAVTGTRRSPSPKYLDAEADFLNPWSEDYGMQSFRAEGEQAQELRGRGRGRHRREVSDVTVTESSDVLEHAETPPQTPTMDDQALASPMIDVRPSSAPSTPPLISDSEDDVLPFLDVPTPPDNIRLKRLTGASQRRAFSPMPQPQNLFLPVTQPRKQFTTALVRKTCEILLGPPAHLVTLMLRIAAQVSNGVFRFDTYSMRHTVEKIPCSWESSDEDEWEEDDYGIPLSNLESSTLRRRARSGEVD